MRYAIYYTPLQHHPLTKCVESWLGRSAFSDQKISTSHGLDRFLDAPRKYGFHGTLKAPFHLADGVSEKELVELFDRFAANHQTLTIDKITLARLGNFLALVPASHSQELNTLADDVVRTFEHLRAPLSDVDLKRRNPSKLPDRQREYLMRWGYPYVFEEFNFHLTLTGNVPKPDQDSFENAIRSHFSEFIDQPLLISSLGLFVERERGEPFTVKRTANLT